jgi:hypothetical protein
MGKVDFTADGGPTMGIVEGLVLRTSMVAKM